MTTTISIVDVLIALLEGEQAGLFHFMADADPHISRASAALRKPLGNMIATSKRHEEELTSLISDLGGTPRPVPVNPENQYIAFLTTDFLLPKLADAKRESMKRYEQSLRQIDGADSEIGRASCRERG